MLHSTRGAATPLAVHIRLLATRLSTRNTSPSSLPSLLVPSPIHLPRAIAMASYPFCYAPLDQASCEIRLLVLSATRHADHRLQGRLIIKSLDASPKYEALSYTWGLPSESNFKIWVNGILVPVRRNLLCALRVLRRPQERVLWIDALCINQNDESEKSHQVGLMRDIYMRATRVLSWLGTPDVEELRCLNLDTKNATPQKLPLPVFAFMKLAVIENSFYLRTGRHPLSPEDVIDSEKFKQVSVLDGDLDEFWPEFLKICDLAYWKRVWVFQEVYLASKARLYYGTKSIGWRTFIDFCTLLDQTDWDNDTRYDCASSSGSFRFLRSLSPTCAANSKTRLVDVLQASLLQCCSDKRDKLYGVLGLQDRVVRQSIPVDYRKSIFDVYADFMKLPTESHADLIHLSIVLQRSLLMPLLPGDGLGEISHSRQEAILQRDGLGGILPLEGQRVGVCECVLEDLATFCESSNTKRPLGMLWDWVPKCVWHWLHEVTRSCSCRQLQLSYAGLCSLKKVFSACSNEDKQTMASVFHSEGGELVRESSDSMAIFTTAEGCIGLSPQGITLGDEVWKCVCGNIAPQEPEIFFVVRRTGEHTEVISRALVFRQKKFDGHKSGEEQLERFEIAMPIFQVLTCPIKYFNNEDLIDLFFWV